MNRSRETAAPSRLALLRDDAVKRATSPRMGGPRARYAIES